MATISFTTASLSGSNGCGFYHSQAFLQFTTEFFQHSHTGIVGVDMNNTPFGQ
jgi:hypothetical protein